MIFGESGAKDLYRRIVWGPLGEGLQAAPLLWETRFVRALGRAAAAALPAKVAHVEANMRRGLGDRPDLHARARDSFATHFGNQYIGFLFGKVTAETWPRYLELRGLHHLDAARAGGRGVVLMHPHMGPAQLPLHVLGVRGLPMHQVGGGRVTAVELSETGQWAADTRAALEDRIAATLHDGRRFLRPVLRALADGDVVLSACDGTGGGEEMGRRYVRSVLGQPMGVPVGPVWMAWQAGAPLLTVHCWRRRPADGDGADRTDGGHGSSHFIAEIGPPVDLPAGRGRAAREAAFEAGADAVAAFLSRAIAAHPGDWHFWDVFEPGGLLPSSTSSAGGRP